MPPTPLLSIQSIPTISAHMLTLSFAVSYVGSLYISKNARLSFASRPPAPARNGEARQKVVNERWRDDPDVIKARLASVSLATFVCCVGVLAVVWHSLRGGNIVSHFFLKPFVCNVNFSQRRSLWHYTTLLGVLVSILT
jgi:prenyl protein peptidase